MKWNEVKCNQIAGQIFKHLCTSLDNNITNTHSSKIKQRQKIIDTNHESKASCRNGTSAAIYCVILVNWNHPLQLILANKNEWIVFHASVWQAEWLHKLVPHTVVFYWHFTKTIRIELRVAELYISEMTYSAQLRTKSGPMKSCFRAGWNNRSNANRLKFYINFGSHLLLFLRAISIHLFWAPWSVHTIYN